MMWDSFQTLHLMLKNLSFINSETQTYVCRLVYAYACIRHVHTTLGHACAYMCMRMHARRFIGLNFPKIDLFSS